MFTWKSNYINKVPLAWLAKNRQNEEENEWLFTIYCDSYETGEMQIGQMWWIR